MWWKRWEWVWLFPLFILLFSICGFPAYCCLYKRRPLLLNWGKNGNRGTKEEKEGKNTKKETVFSTLPSCVVIWSHTCSLYFSLILFHELNSVIRVCHAFGLPLLYTCASVIIYNFESHYDSVTWSFFLLLWGSACSNSVGMTRSLFMYMIISIWVLFLLSC